MIAATGADYVALGHWDRPPQVGDGSIPAYYSGSPALGEDGQPDPPDRLTATSPLRASRSIKR